MVVIVVVVIVVVVVVVVVIIIVVIIIIIVVVVVVDKIMSGDSSVSIATGYGLDDRMIGVRFPLGGGWEFFSSLRRPD
jgi:hypothetical protein